MEEALVARLLADSGVSSRVEKVVWGVRPQGTALPAVVLLNASPGRGYTFKSAGGLSGSLIQFDVWALKFSEAIAVFRALLVEMETPVTVGDTEFGMSFLERQSNGSEDVPGVGTIHRISADFTVWHKPT